MSEFVEVAYTKEEREKLKASQPLQKAKGKLQGTWGASKRQQKARKESTKAGSKKQEALPSKIAYTKEEREKLEASQHLQKAKGTHQGRWGASKCTEAGSKQQEASEFAYTKEECEASQPLQKAKGTHQWWEASEHQQEESTESGGEVAYTKEEREKLEASQPTKAPSFREEECERLRCQQEAEEECERPESQRQEESNAMYKKADAKIEREAEPIEHENNEENDGIQLTVTVCRKNVEGTSQRKGEEDSEGIKKGTAESIEERGEEENASVPHRCHVHSTALSTDRGLKMKLSQDEAGKFITKIASQLDTNFVQNTLSPELEIPYQRVKDIADYHREPLAFRIEVLNVWYKMKGKEATFEKLVLALEVTQNQATADFIKFELFK